MARKTRKTTARRRKQRTGATRASTSVRRRSMAARRRSRRAQEAIEEVRRGPLQPEVPLAPDAPLAALDPDALETLDDTQDVRPDDSSGGLVGAEPIDRQRGTVLTGGDVDAAWDEVDTGEETVGGSTPTPDQDVVDDLGRAAGVTYSGTEPLRGEDKVIARDEKRWELDPASAEDYPERARRTRRSPRR